MTTRIYDIENDDALLFEKPWSPGRGGRSRHGGRRSGGEFHRQAWNFAFLLYHNDTGVAAGFIVTLDNAEVFQYESVDDFDDKVKAGKLTLEPATAFQGKAASSRSAQTRRAAVFCRGHSQGKDLHH